MINGLISMASSDNADIEEPRLRAEYAIWKKNTPYLYDLIITTRLPWPSLTVEWLPEVEIAPLSTKNNILPPAFQTNSKYTTGIARYKLLLGTQTSGHAYEYVRIGAIDIPNLDAMSSGITPSLLNQYDTVIDEFGGYKTSGCQFKIHQYLDHKDEVNRARYFPQNPSIIATGSSNGFIYLFDCTKHPLDPRNVTSTTTMSESIALGSIQNKEITATQNDGVSTKFTNTLKSPYFRPDMTMEAHTSEVSSLSWNQFKQGILASGSYDNTVGVWDIQSWHRSKNLSPVSVLRTHSDLVNDVEWHKFNPGLLGSVSDDGEAHIHDTRVPTASFQSQLHSVKLFDSQSPNSNVGVNSISFNPASENLFVTGGTDARVILWDLRFLSSPLHYMHGHADNINSVEWSPHEPTILASASSDRRVCIWDVSRVKDSNFDHTHRESHHPMNSSNNNSRSSTRENEIDPPPELLWVHGGHTESVSDISWNPALPWVLASVSNDNHIHIFKPSKNLVAGEDIK